MTLNVLFSAPPERWDEYRDVLPRVFADAGLDVNLSTDMPPEVVDYIVYAPNDSLIDFGPYTNTKAVLSLWAGVEGIVGNESLTMPLTRMVDSGLSEGMVEWVCGHTLFHHLGMAAQLSGRNGDWNPRVPPLARNRNVAVLGLGQLGQACALALAGLNFNVSGWSRSPKTIDGITCYSGADGLRNILSQAEILILLLPLTAGTENLLDADRLSLLPRGAVILNPGRGALIDDDALLASLDSGRVAHAVLDVFRIEPLPAEHPYWAHPQVTVTPHIASETRPETSAMVIAENIRRSEAGEPLLYKVDRAAGY